MQKKKKEKKKKKKGTGDEIQNDSLAVQTFHQ